MAAPATHIVLADTLIPKYFPNVDRDAFIVGTSFPDIRYLGVIEREKTHIFAGGINSISQTNSFDAGVNFHVLVDRVRSEYMKKNNVYDLLPQSRFIKQALRMYEDQVLCSEIGEWQEVVKYFDSVYPEEMRYGIDEEKIKNWHQLIVEYLSEQPAQKETMRTFITSLTLPVVAADEIVELVQQIDKAGRVRKYVEDFYLNFEELTTDLIK
jgi:hypothetical protein